jgi:N-methylhydantoinase A
MAWRIAIDTGGTFTDVVALNEVTAERHVLKVNSTPKDPSIALTQGVQRIAEKLGFALGDISNIMHGTTAATNAILEGDYPLLGLIVTRGFRDILEIRRQDVPGDFGDINWWIKPDRVVPLELVREVHERLDFRGRVLAPLDEAAVGEAASEFREMGVNAIAVSLIHSYVDPTHERRCQEIIHEVHPDCFVSLSSDVIREYREYERTQGTCLNTALMPLMSSYIDRISQRLGAAGVKAQIFIMKSSGGVADAAELSHRPLCSVLSGPAAGVMAAAHSGPSAGFDNLLTLDVGGTSADIALIEGKMPRILNSGRIEDHDIKVPMIDMTTVGAGGGSIAWIADNGALRVGPESAGSEPGPACYGRGGKRPTLTDAHLVLGRISPELLGGAVKLDVDAARHAIATQIAQPLKLSVERAADGILEIAVQNMVSGIRMVSVSRGRDPRNLTLLPFGGGGAMHATLVADDLGMTRIFVPTAPGAMSAEGLLLSDVRVDHAITFVRKEKDLDAAALDTELLALRHAVAVDLRRQGFDPATSRLEAHAELRYLGQAYEIRIPLSIDKTAKERMADAFGAFHVAHEDRYGFSYKDQHEVELVNLSVAGFGPLSSKPKLPDSRTSGKRPWSDFRKHSRPMFDRRTGAYVDATIYERPFAPVDDEIAGPCVIEQYDTTTSIDVGWAARSLADGNLVLIKV